MSSRNSGVIHAGMYYPENSLKAKFCVEGNKLLYEYANQKNIAHKKTGKFIISTRKSELHKLDKIYEQGLANGVIIKKCSRNEIKNKEPSLNVNAGLYSPATCIIDVPEFVTALEGDIQHKGGIISFNSEFLSAKKINIDLLKGKYCWMIGPAYETPAEIQYLRSIGGDAVGMSTLPEIECAKKLGMKIMVLSTLTNFAAGLKNEVLKHEDVLSNAKKTEGNFSKLIQEIINQVSRK